MTTSIPASFITFNTATNVFSITPAAVADIGVWTVTITLTDTLSNSNTSPFTVTVTNVPPAYVVPSVIYPSITIPLNSVKEVPIFPNYDPEGGSVSVLVSDSFAVPVNSIVAGDFSKITFSPITFN